MMCTYYHLNCETIGNVALDCARILAKGRDKLIDTDIASHALQVLGQGVKRTTVVGRRGHIQGAFTIKVCRNEDAFALLFIFHPLISYFILHRNCVN